MIRCITDTTHLVVANMFSVPLGIIFGADVNLTVNIHYLQLNFFFAAHGRRIHQEVLPIFVIIHMEIN